jgi:hypothetical protein
MLGLCANIAKRKASRCGRAATARWHLKQVAARTDTHRPDVLVGLVLTAAVLG